jgi:hypothetical protein
MKFKYLKNNKLWHSLVMAIWLLPICAFAQSIGSYCLTKSPNNKVPEFRKSIDRSKLPDPQITFTHKGQAFHLVATHNVVQMYDAQNNLISDVHAQQDSETLSFNELILGKSGWLWVDGYSNNYLVKMSFDESLPTFGQPQPMPVLYYERYSYLSQWLGDPYIERGHFSRSLDRVFISGYPLSYLGISIFGWPAKISYEIINGKQRLLPADLQDTTLEGWFRYDEKSGNYIYADFPGFGGALFRSKTGDALFYDGDKVISLFDKLKNEDGTYSRWYAHPLPTANHTLIEARINNVQMVFDLTADHKLKKRLVIPDEIIAKTGFMISRFYMFPESQQLFVFNGLDNSIMAEINGILHPGIKINNPWQLRISDDIINKNRMTFIVSKGNSLNIPSDFEAREYSLVPATPTTQCLGYFNVDQPFELQVE